MLYSARRSTHDMVPHFFMPPQYASQYIYPYTMYDRNTLVTLSYFIKHCGNPNNAIARQFEIFHDFVWLPVTLIFFFPSLSIDYTWEYVEKGVNWRFASLTSYYFTQTATCAHIAIAI